jgi:hypothetical protein
MHRERVGEITFGLVMSVPLSMFNNKGDSSYAEWQELLASAT